MNQDQHRQHAIERLARVVRAARDGGPADRAQVSRLAAEWPDLAHAIHVVLHEHDESSPEEWRRPDEGDDVSRRMYGFP